MLANESNKLSGESYLPVCIMKAVANVNVANG